MKTQLQAFKAAISEWKYNNRVLCPEEMEVASSPVEVMCNTWILLTAASSRKPKTEVSNLSAIYTAGRK
jgi:hypothetical protein